MIIKTMNSYYHLTDLGDGGFTVVGKDHNNGEGGLYCVEPTICTMDHTPVIGESMWLTRRDGPKAGRTIITSKVVEIVP